MGLQHADPTDNNILLIEDDEYLAKVYETRLKAGGYNIKRILNDQDLSTSFVEEFKPNLILHDATMPKVNTFDILDVLRKTPENTNVHIIIIPALRQDANKLRAEDLVVNEYFLKTRVEIGENEVIENFQTDGSGRLLGIPTVVLINEGGASDKEIAAGVLGNDNTYTLANHDEGKDQKSSKYSEINKFKVTVARWSSYKDVEADK